MWTTRISELSDQFKLLHSQIKNQASGFSWGKNCQLSDQMCGQKVDNKAAHQPNYFSTNQKLGRYKK
jgi:hypothetical protein